MCTLNKFYGKIYESSWYTVNVCSHQMSVCQNFHTYPGIVLFHVNSQLELV
jgi:hypothetical protein